MSEPTATSSTPSLTTSNLSPDQLSKYNRHSSAPPRRHIPHEQQARTTGLHPGSSAAAYAWSEYVVKSHTWESSDRPHEPSVYTFQDHTPARPGDQVVQVLEVVSESDVAFSFQTYALVLNTKPH